MEKQKVYLVMVHKVGENPWVHSVWSTREKATNSCNILNCILKDKGMFADFISEIVDEGVGK